MDFINQAYAQLVELFRSLSVGTRIATALLLAVVVVSLVYLFQYHVAGGDEFLLGGRSFTSSELTAIETSFAKANLGQSQVVGGQIRIPRGQKELYLAAMAENGALPADFYKYLDEAAAADSPFSSTKSLEIRHGNAKQKELALIIRKMKNIESANVQYDEETKPGLVRQKQKTAMVAVQTSGAPLEEEQVKAIRNVVASAYAGLDRHHITITDMTSGFTYGGQLGPDGQPEEESLYATHKLRHEREWQQKIQTVLSYIPRVIVGVNAELDPELQHSSQTVKLDPKPVTVKSNELRKESTSHAPQVAGRVGAQGNGVGNTQVQLQQTTSSGPESQTTEERTDNQNIPGHDTTVVQRAPLLPKKVTASIYIPSSYFASVWKQNNPQPPDKPAKQPDPAELATIETELKNSIKEVVRNLLPDVDKGTNPYPHIVVEKYIDLPSPPSAPPTLAANAGNWLADNWRTFALIGVGLVSLLMLRGMVRSPAVASSALASEGVASPRLAATESMADDEEAEPERVLKNRFRTGGPDLKVELHEIVKENPDAAATILRAWIGEAA